MFQDVQRKYLLECIKDLQSLSGEIEMDETMFGGKRPDKQGWGATGKTIVFGIY